jgi:Myb-like DNA-binding protein REB1
VCHFRLPRSLTFYIFVGIRAVADLGQQWEKVSEIVGRMSSDCRDRYRNHIANREVRVTGVWTKEEEEELTAIVTEMTIQQGKDFDNDVFWGKVSDRMGNRRGRQQCRIKWTDSLSKTVKNEGQKPRWSAQDAYILVHKVDSMNVRDDTEIDWKTLPDSDWNLWSAHSLQRRWLTMKRGIKGYEDMTHQEIMDILRVKKAHLPPTSAARKRKVTSAANIDEPAEPEPGDAGPSGIQEGASDGQDRDADGSTDDSDA